MEDGTRKKDMQSAILKLVDSVSPSVGRIILREYEKIPYTIKDAVDELYAALNDITDSDSIETVKDALNKLRDACEANPTYKEVYKVAKKEAQEEIAEVVANEGMDVFEADE